MFTVAGLCIDNNTFVSLIKAYPNPTDRMVNVSLETNTENFTVEVLNNIGQIIKTTEFTNTNNGTVCVDGSSGVYFLRITKSDGEKAVIRISKK